MKLTVVVENYTEPSVLRQTRLAELDREATQNAIAYKLGTMDRDTYYLSREDFERAGELASTMTI